METQRQESIKQEAREPVDQSYQISKRLTPVMIAIVTIVVQAFSGLYAGLGQKQTRGTSLIGYLILVGMMGHWLKKDSRQYRIPWVFDMGFFLCLAWPVILPVYLFKTRGVKAILIILSFLGIFVGAFIAGGLLGAYLIRGIP